MEITLRAQYLWSERKPYLTCGNVDTSLEVEMWDGGLQEQEVLAIEKIKAAFSANVSKPDKPVRGGSIGEQLQSYGFTGNGMFPWKGYAGFRFVEAKKEGEFDLVIVTHCNVIIVELKDWNHQPVTARGDTWYKGDMNMGRSPVSVTRGKKIHYSMVMNKVTDKHNVLQEDRGIGKCMINRILWAVMN